MKKTISVFVSVLLFLNLFTFDVNAKDSGTMPVKVNAKAAILMDQTTGKVLMSMNQDERLYPASVTKIMTMLLVAEAIDDGKISMDDTVTASANAVKKGGSQIWLKEGETMSVKDLYKAMTVDSANDACTALAETVSGSEESFINLMNERASQLGMRNTHFENCTGLDDTSENHLTTAYDIALMARELMTHKFVTDFTTIWMDSLRNGATELVNTNKLVRFYQGCTGLKTGTTSKAGCCLCATATRDGTSLIAVVLGCSNSTDRFEGAKTMLNYGFANWSTVTPQPDMSLITDVNVIMGEEKSITPKVPESTALLIPKGKEKDIVQDIELAASVEAPVEINQVLGTVRMSIDGEEIGSYPLTSPRYIERITVKSVIISLLKSLCGK